MLKLFCPDIFIDDIYQLDLEIIKKKNKKGILIDLDNTLLPWDSFTIEERLKKWIDECKQAGFSLCILSNNKAHRINRCAKELGIPAALGSLKPRKKAFKNGLSILGTTPEQTVIIGDQIFTDVLGGKRMGILTILVRPISSRELWWTKLMRKVERILLNKLVKKNMISL